MKSLSKTLKQYSLSNKDEESCGLILSIDGTLDFAPCKNDAENRKSNFIINEKDYLKASLKGKIISIFHSQQSDEFSELDIINSNGHNLKSIIYSLKKDCFKEFVPNKYTNPYIGRSFQYGSSDCFGLVRDYYKKELNISIGNYARDIEWIAQPKNIYDLSFAKEGFKKVDNLKKHDILMMKFLDFDHPSHVGVYLGNDLFLHHPIHDFSRIEHYNNRFKKKTMYLVRHGSYE